MNHLQLLKFIPPCHLLRNACMLQLEFSPWGEMVSLSMSLHISQSQFCVPCICTLQSMWLAQNLREPLQNSPGTAYCTGGSKAKYEDMKGLLWCQCMSESWCESCCDLLDCYNQIHPLPISFRGASHAHTSMQVLPMLQGLQVQCQELRWQNYQGKQGYETSSVLYAHRV